MGSACLAWVHDHVHPHQTGDLVRVRTNLWVTHTTISDVSLDEGTEFSITWLSPVNVFVDQRSIRLSCGRIVDSKGLMG